MYKQKHLQIQSVKQVRSQIYQVLFQFDTNKNRAFGMNFANYSPHNKSYRFICFQNQAYHQKNKRIASPCIKTNIRYSLNKNSDNPEGFSGRRTQSSHRFSRSNHSDVISSQLLGNSMIRSSSSSNALIGQNKRVIHKHESFEKFKVMKISNQNTKMVDRLLQAQPQVIKKQETQKSFNSHLRYRDIRKKYNAQGARRTKMCLGNSSLLCPTLSQFNKTGLAQKFVQLDLSMSMTSSMPRASLRKRRSDFERQNQAQN